MIQPQVLEGTPEELATHLKKLPNTTKYRMTIEPEEPQVTQKPGQMITFGMFPQLQALTEDDFKDAEWRGEGIEL